MALYQNNFLVTEAHLAAGVSEKESKKILLKLRRKQLRGCSQRTSFCGGVKKFKVCVGEETGERRGRRLLF
jgi:hypothetical protein